MNDKEIQKLQKKIDELQLELNNIKSNDNTELWYPHFNKKYFVVDAEGDADTRYAGKPAEELHKFNVWGTKSQAEFASKGTSAYMELLKWSITMNGGEVNEYGVYYIGTDRHGNLCIDIDMTCGNLPRFNSSADCNYVIDKLTDNCKKWLGL